MHACTVKKNLAFLEHGFAHGPALQELAQRFWLACGTDCTHASHPLKTEFCSGQRIPVVQVPRLIVYGNASGRGV